MYGIIFSAINSALSFIFKTAIVKFVLFFGLYFVVSEFIEFLSSKLPSFTNLDGLFLGLPSGVWYFLDICQFGRGFSLVLSAFLLRFMIRRIPFIGG